MVHFYSYAIRYDGFALRPSADSRLAIQGRSLLTDHGAGSMRSTAPGSSSVSRYNSPSGP
jgi:hypothetical protein